MIKDELKNILKETLNELYNQDNFLFERNNNKGVCERSLAFRFSHHLQNHLIYLHKNNYFVDCDFNSSKDHNGIEYQGKGIQNENGTVTKRFIDLIVHNRNNENYFAIEIKKWNHVGESGLNKDYNNLKQLTSKYGYEYGISLILGPNLRETYINIFTRTSRNPERINFN